MQSSHRGYGGLIEIDAADQDKMLTQGLRWTNEIDATDQDKLIILSSTSTRTFSNCNVMLITHEKCITNLHMTKKINLMG
jgi:hypothetical protein